MFGQSKYCSSGRFERAYDIRHDLLFNSLLLVLCFSASLRAQVGMATLSGTVTDPTGLPYLTRKSRCRARRKTPAERQSRTQAANM